VEYVVQSIWYDVMGDQRSRARDITAWAVLKGKGVTGPMEGPGSTVPGVSSKGANLLASL